MASKWGDDPPRAAKTRLRSALFSAIRRRANVHSSPRRLLLSLSTMSWCNIASPGLVFVGEGFRYGRGGGSGEGPRLDLTDGRIWEIDPHIPPEMLTRRFESRLSSWRWSNSSERNTDPTSRICDQGGRKTAQRSRRSVDAKQERRFELWIRVQA